MPSLLRQWGESFSPASDQVKNTASGVQTSPIDMASLCAAFWEEQVDIPLVSSHGGRDSKGKQIIIGQHRESALILSGGAVSGCPDHSSKYV